MASPPVSLCTGRLHASTATAGLEGKDVGERRGNRCGPAAWLAWGLYRAGDLGPVPGSCPALAASLHEGKAEMQHAAGSGELEFPRQQPVPVSPFTPAKPSA